ncbi:hypothetical protein TNIN_327551 [Trichonephila inaurata madagascariensis]|uniref:Uncharacterized protein n=1 Tax=Trichonephila inaurata madagascariensis TaxID=2747483 RepID=A0A8X6MFV4_9ARAC|nr:hypothetical protein TNIN_327551 [Trichonephila inaurata madagascariensis]
MESDQCCIAIPYPYNRLTGLLFERAHCREFGVTDDNPDATVLMCRRFVDDCSRLVGVYASEQHLIST